METITKKHVKAKNIFLNMIISPLGVDFQKRVTHKNQKAGQPCFSRQAGCLLEIRGFPSPSYEGFGFIVGLFVFNAKKLV